MLVVYHCYMLSFLTLQYPPHRYYSSSSEIDRACSSTDFAFDRTAADVSQIITGEEEVSKQSGDGRSRRGSSEDRREDLAGQYRGTPERSVPPRNKRRRHQPREPTALKITEV